MKETMVFVMMVTALLLGGCSEKEPEVCVSCSAFEMAIEMSLETNEKLFTQIKDLKATLASATDEIIRMQVSQKVAISEPNTIPRYGDGDPPPEYMAMFGNGNNARLNFLQELRLNELSQRIAKLEKVTDPNEVK